LFKVTSAAINPDLCEVGGGSSVMDVLRGKKGLSTSISESLGALVIGVLVLAGIGVGIGAAYNYSQDSNAKASLDAVKSAEVLYQAKNAKFGIITDLTGGTDPALSSSAPNVKIVATDINYCAIVKSGSMFAKNFWITSQDGEILTAAPSATDQTALGLACPTAP
jgi:hypothetical protein